MECNRFDELTKNIDALTRRRAVVKVLGVAAATPLLGLLGAPLGDAAANTAGGPITKPRKPKKKRRVRKKRYFKEKHTFCLNGRTVQSKRKRRIRKWQRQGATRGRCAVDPTCNPPCVDGTVCVRTTCEVCDVSCPSGDRIACGAALNLALGNGGTIRVCPGEYAGPFPLTASVEIIGFGSGANPAVDTILFGVDGLGSVVPVTSAVTARLASLRITGGNGDSSNSGGVYVNNAGADVTIDGCALVGNVGSYGGGASVYNGELTIIGSEIRGNTATNGGAIATASLSTIESTRITGNTATGAGGGVFLNSGTMTLGSGVTITRNNSTGGDGTGGGIYKYTSSSTINNSATVTNNTPENCAGYGFVFTCP